MSHVAQTTCPIDDIPSLAEAVQSLGCEFVEGQKSYAWWGVFVGDFPLPEGVKEEDLGKCNHAIKIPGCEWEVGVVESKTAPGTYNLLYDFFEGEGDRIHAKLGNKLGTLQQRYALTRTKNTLARSGVKSRFNTDFTSLEVEEKEKEARFT